MRALQVLCLIAGAYLMYTSPSLGSGLNILGYVFIGVSIVIGLVINKNKEK